MNQAFCFASVVSMSVAALPSWAADFAPAGATARLTVEYRFESNGKQADKYDLREWRVKRSVDLTAQLVAGKPQPLPSLQPAEAGQTARLQQQAATMQKAQAQMAPMMGDVQAIVARCGGDEKCIERETMKLGFGMSGSARLESDLKLGKATGEATQPGADRYQRWQGRSQTGRYAVDEAWHVRHADPICMTLPGQRCNHDLARSGGAEWPAGPTSAQAEIDAQAGTITLMLPAPADALDVVETQTTDEPAGTHSTPTPKGPQKARLGFRTWAEGKGPALITLPLKGGWRTQSGEQVVAMGAGAWHGASGEGGKLVIRWRFVAQ